DRYSAAYQEEVPAERAAEDIHRIARLADGESRLELKLRQGDAPSRIEFAAYSHGRPIPLYVAIEILENMGLKVIGERDYFVRLDDDLVAIQIFRAETASSAPVDADAIAEPFEETFARVLYGEIDNDRFNSYVAEAALCGPDAMLAPAVGRYLGQTAGPLGLPYVQDVPARHPKSCAALVGYCHAAFDPAPAARERAKQRAAHEQTIAAEPE